MCDSGNRNELTLTPARDSSCSCCSPAAPSGPAETSDAASERPHGAAATLDVGLDGLTCGHCVQTVEKALSAVDGVESTSIELVPGGTSRLRVTGTADLSAVRDALAPTGYSLSER